jgi:hypothetical protein
MMAFAGTQYMISKIVIEDKIMEQVNNVTYSGNNISYL